MSQSKGGSAIEAACNIGVGLAVSMVANAIVFPLFGFTPSIGENITITGIYTAISFARSYLLRRLFNSFKAKRSERESYWWNAPEVLPPVGCPLVLNLGPEYDWDIAHGERVSHLSDRGGVMDYRLSTGQVVRGRFAWSYP